MRQQREDGIIFCILDAPYGFTPDRFREDSYLWQLDGYVLISLIESKAKGNFRDLVQQIQADGFGVKVPSPSNEMRRIVTKNGYRQIEECGAEVWVLETPKETTMTTAEKIAAQKKHCDEKEYPHFAPGSRRGFTGNNHGEPSPV